MIGFPEIAAVIQDTYGCMNKCLGDEDALLATNGSGHGDPPENVEKEPGQETLLHY